jgi:hypothetical protein
MDTTTGVTINTSGYVANNLSVGGELVVGSTNILTAITDLQNKSSDLSSYYNKTETDNSLNAKQNTIDSASVIAVKHIRAVGTLPTSSTSESVELGRDGVKATVRIASMYATLRLQGVGETESWKGWSIQRNNISQTTRVFLGTTVYQSWDGGTNNFYKDITCLSLTSSAVVTAVDVVATGELHCDG